MIGMGEATSTLVTEIEVGDRVGVNRWKVEVVGCTETKDGPRVYARGSTDGGVQFALFEKTKNTVLVEKGE